MSRQKGLAFICEVRLQDNNKNNKLLSLGNRFNKINQICSVRSKDFSLCRVLSKLFRSQIRSKIDFAEASSPKLTRRKRLLCLKT